MPDVWFQAPLIGTSSAPFMRNGDSELFSKSPFLHAYWHHLNRQCVSSQWQVLPAQQYVKMAREMNFQEGTAQGRGNRGRRSEIWLWFRFLCSSKNNIKALDTLTSLVIWSPLFCGLHLFVFSPGWMAFSLGYSCFQTNASPSLIRGLWRSNFRESLLKSKLQNNKCGLFLKKPGWRSLITPVHPPPPKPGWVWSHPLPSSPQRTIYPQGSW